MDRTVPRGAAILLAFIYETETSRTPPECYEVIFGHRQSALSKPLTTMTVAEVQEAQRTWSTKAWARRFGSTKASSAAGAAQFMRKTLAGLRTELGLRDGQIFDPDLQDRLAYHLLKRRGYETFMAGEIGATEFAKRLAMEWASFPVLVPTQGAHRKLKRGQSYYAGDGLNKALVAPEKIEALLARVGFVGTSPAPAQADPAPETTATENAAPDPAPAPKAGIAALIVAMLLAAGAFIAGIPCDLFGVLCS